MAATKGGPPTVWIGADANNLRPYTLVPSTSGPYQRTPISEFYAPIRLGQAEYDDRLPASTLTLSDYTGGAGKYLPDSRQEASRFWYSTCDTRFAGIVSLPPNFTIRSLSTQPGSTNGAAAFAYAGINSQERFYFATGNRIYNTSGTSWTDLLALGTSTDLTYRLRRMYTTDATPTTTENLFWMRSNGMYQCSGDPAVSGNWSVVLADVVDVSQSPLNTTTYLRMMQSGLIETVDIPAGTSPDIGSIGSGGHFLGTMAGIVYMVDGGGSLWSYDATAAAGEQLRREADALPRITGGAVYQNAQIVLTDGRRTVQWHPTRPQRDVTIGAPDGVSSIDTFTVRGIFVIADRLLAYTTDTVAEDLSVWEFRGSGWHRLAAFSATWLGSTGATYRRMTDTGFGFDPVNQRHWVGMNEAGTVVTYSNTLPPGGENPYVQELITAGDGFESSGTLETGWHYCGLRGLSGPLLQVVSLAEFSDTHQSVVVKYRTDFDETSGWTTLGTLSKTVRALTLASGAGVAFRVVRFRFELAQTGGGGGGTSTKSPNAAVRIDFLKVPAQLYRRAFQVDLSRSAMRQRRPIKTLMDALVTLAEQTTLPVVRFEDEGNLFLKLEAPREQSYLDYAGKKAGAVAVISGQEVT